MATIRNKNGETFEVSDADAAKMQADDPSLQVVGDVAMAPEAQGNIVATQDASSLGDVGAQAASGADLNASAQKQYLESKTSAPGAAARSVASGATFGFTDAFADPATIEADREIHPGIYWGGQVAGAFLDPASIERMGSALSSKFLYAGEIGAEANTAAKIAEKGLARGAEASDGLSRLVSEADLPNVERAGERASVVNSAADYRKAVKDANPWLVIDQGGESAVLTKTDRAIRGALDAPETLAKNPGRILEPLEKQRKALESAIANQSEIAARLDSVNETIANGVEKSLADLAPDATHVELSGKAARRYASYADVKIGKAASVSVPRETAQSFVDAIRAGEVRGASQEALGALQGLVEKNKALRDSIDELRATKKSGGLLEGMLGGTVMHHVAGLVGGMPIVGTVLGAKAGALASDFVFGRLGKAATEIGARTQSAIKSFLNLGAKASARPVLASRVLARAAFAPQDKEAPQPRGLAESFKARSQEIRSQTMYDPTGTPVMRPEARQAVSDRLAAVRANSPVLADKLETIAARRMEFLSSKLPRRPDLPGVLSGPDRWQPSDMEMRMFARYVAAVEDPGGVEERLAAGTVTPEDAEAYRAVYPERFAAMQTQILQTLPTLKKSLPYQRRLSLSIFSGVPVDPSMAPNVVAALQSQFEQEPGTDGGVTPPTPQPAFGSVKKSLEQPTPAQHRAQ